MEADRLSRHRRLARALSLALSLLRLALPSSPRLATFSFCHLKELRRLERPGVGQLGKLTAPRFVYWRHILWIACVRTSKGASWSSKHSRAPEFDTENLKLTTEFFAKFGSKQAAYAGGHLIVYVLLNDGDKIFISHMIYFWRESALSNFLCLNSVHMSEKIKP